MAQDTTTNDQIKMAQKQSINCIAFSGGGAKGAIYAGAYQELVENNIWSGVSAVAGSSAGAITAALTAAGLSHQEFTSVSQNTNLKGLLGEGTLMTNHDAIPLYELLRDNISKPIAGYLASNDINSLCRNKIVTLDNQIKTLDQSLEPDEILRLKEARDKLHSFQENNKLEELSKRINNSGTVYFKDLDILSILEPDKFKSLTVTATRKDDGSLMLFNAANSPDTEIAIAAKASACIPIVFKPTEINGVQYVDGGCRDNIPITYFDKPELAQKVIEQEKAKEQQNEKQYLTEVKPEDMPKIRAEKRALAMVFGSSDPTKASEAHVAIYTDNSQKPGLWSKFTDAIVRFVTKIGIKAEKGQEFNYSQDNAKTYKTLRKNALNTVILDTKTIGTLSFDDAQKNAEYLHLKGLLQTRRHLVNHDLGADAQSSLPMQEFMLALYEQGKFEQKAGWASKILLSDIEPKQAALLKNCQDETWRTVPTQDIITNVVTIAGQERKKSGGLSTDTKTIQNLITLLNKPNTPDIVKDSFRVALDLEIGTHKNFSAKDFQPLIDKHIATQKENITNKTATEKLKEQEASMTQNNNLQK